MQIGVMVDLGEWLHLCTEFLRIRKDGMTMVGHAPGARVDVLALIELAFLMEAAEFSVLVAAANCPTAAARLLAILEDLNFVANLAQFIGSDHASEAGAENEHRSALRITVQ